MTAAEFLAIPPDGKRYELINGQFIVHSTPPVRHQCVLGNLLVDLATHCRNREAEVFPGPLDVHLSDDSVVEPDALVIRRERASIIGDDYIHGAPDILIEVISDETRRRDEIVKPELYARCGVDEYWVVDPDNVTVTIHRNATETRVETGGTITTPLLPGFALDVNVIFEI